MSRHSDCMFDTSVLVPVGRMKVNAPPSQRAAEVEASGREEE